MGRKLLVIILSFASVLAVAQQRPGSLRGTITDAKTGETVPFANIVIKDNAGTVITGGTSDIDGRYNINPVSPGTYNVEASFTGYATVTITDIIIAPNSPTYQDFKLREESEMLTEVVIEYTAPLIDKSKSSSVTTSEDIVNMAVRDITSVASQAAGVTQDANGNTNVRGQRAEGTVYFIDGVKVRGSVNIPQAAIAQTEVITGGLPAQYGDAVGGVISTTTRGPSGTYFGTAEILTSYPFQFIKYNQENPYYYEGSGSDESYKYSLDAQNYNLGAFTVGGPINLWKDDQGNNRLGFLFSSEFLFIEEPRPGLVPYASLSDEDYDDLHNNPITVDSTGTGYVYRSELVTEEDLTNVQVRPNSQRREIRMNGSLQIKTSRLSQLSFGGRWVYNNSKNPSYVNHIFNHSGNRDFISNDWSVFARFQQSFANDPESNSLIKNAFYNIQVDYSRDYNKTYDANHDKDFFNYGHVGQFDIQNQSRYQYGLDTVAGVYGYRFVGLDDTAVAFTPGTVNPSLTNYMRRYYELSEEYPGLITSDFQTLLSTVTPPINGQNPLSVYNGLWTNVGAVQGGYNETRNSQFRVTASTNFDIKDHSLILGFEYEQRIDRGYSLTPTALWSQARLLQNRPNSELDLNNPILVTKDGVYQDTILYNYAYDPVSSSAFAENIRSALGMDPFSTEQINIDNLDLSVFDISMFSPDEVINPNGTRYVSYYGYDYTGNIARENASVSDFFLARDDNGRFTRPVAAFQPIYIAGYIQDQFSFNDLTFNVGVRVDRFDLNQSVLRDPYVLFPYYTVGDLPNSPLAGSVENIPGGIGSDYAVYVSSYDYSNAQIVGYRDGDNWFNAAGEPLNDPSLLSDAAGGGIKPFTILTPEERAQQSEELYGGAKTLPEESFVDYTPQTVVMPRIAFNFPITDQALFIAHYDLLAQRPTTGISRLDPFDYLDLLNSDNGSLVNNPDLRPQKTTEYELGFKQILTEKSALKISAYYREMRDLLQTVNYAEAYPITYIAYGNRDFGTVKGFTLEYEMRRTKNFKIDANYTLQFADGTGSSSTTGVNLAQAGQPNLRFILPLDFDNRHQVLVRMDYRYPMGARYKGPKWGDANILEGFGINLTANGISGSPYTKRNMAFPLTANASNEALVEGQINGLRLPWQVTFNMRVNKVFAVGKSSSNKTFEVYLQILNLFNTYNVTNVYAYTGDPDDDGYLASPEGQSRLQQQVSTQAFIDMYNRRLINPFNYGLPRRVRLGLAYNF